MAVAMARAASALRRQRRRQQHGVGVGGLAVCWIRGPARPWVARNSAHKNTPHYHGPSTGSAPIDNKVDPWRRCDRVVAGGSSRPR